MAAEVYENSQRNEPVICPSSLTMGCMARMLRTITSFIHSDEAGDRSPQGARMTLVCHQSMSCVRASNPNCPVHVNGSPRECATIS